MPVYTQQHTVAVVDDDLGVLDAVKLVLEDRAWIVHTYTRGEEFLQATQQWRFDCVVLDIHLPEMDGNDVVDQLEASDLNLPVVVLTARPHSAQTLSLKNSRIHDVLTKPVSDIVLVSSIESAIQSGAGERNRSS